MVRCGYKNEQTNKHCKEMCLNEIVSLDILVNIIGVGEDPPFDKHKKITLTCLRRSYELWKIWEIRP